MMAGLTLDDIDEAPKGAQNEESSLFDGMR